MREFATLILERGTLLHSYLKILRAYRENVNIKYSLLFLHRDVYVFMINLKHAQYILQAMQALVTFTE